MECNVLMSFDLGDLLKNYISDDKDVYCRDELIIDTVLKDIIYFYYHDDKMYPLTCDNFKKINENEILRFVKTNKSNNIEYREIKNDIILTIGKPTLYLATRKINENNKVLFLKNLSNSFVNERIDNIKIEMSRVINLIDKIYNEIYPNINSKGAHATIKHARFQNDKKKKTCSACCDELFIFRNRESYDKTIVFIKSMGFNVPLIKNDKIESMIWNPNNDNPISGDPNIQIIVYLNIFANIVKNLKEYHNYLNCCIDNIRCDPYILDPQFGFNNVVDDFIIDNNNHGQYITSILIKNEFINAFCRIGTKYYSVKYYELCLNKDNKWYLMFKEDLNKNVEPDKINTVYEYQEFLNKLENDTKKMIKNQHS